MAKDPRDIIQEQLQGIVANAATYTQNEPFTSPTAADNVEFAMRQLQKTGDDSGEKWNMLRAILSTQLYTLAQLAIDDMATTVLRATLETMERYEKLELEGGFRK